MQGLRSYDLSDVCSSINGNCADTGHHFKAKLAVSDILAQYYESEVKRRNRRKLIIVPYTTPTKSEKPIQFSKPSVIPDTGIKVYRNKSGSVELRNIISVSNSEADTQIYSIKSK